MMDLDKLIDDCSAIEHTVSVLTKSNARKQVELEGLQESVLRTIKQKLDQISDREEEIRADLDSLRSQRQDVETEVKGLSLVNERLTNLVSLLQDSTNIAEQVDDSHLNMAASIQDFEHLKSNFIQIQENFKLLNNPEETSKLSIEKLKERQVALACAIFSNYNHLRVLTNVNGYAEEQFDLILSELPWEPLSSSYIETLRNSKSERISNVAEALLIQTSEINDLVVSLSEKKNRKLRVLEELFKELDSLLKSREQAMLMMSSTRTEEGNGS